SVLADGFADQPTTVTVHHRDGTSEEKPSHVGAGVHSADETAMIDRRGAEIREGIPTKLASLGRLDLVEIGKQAAAATIALMDRSARKVPPKKLVDEFVR